MGLQQHETSSKLRLVASHEVKPVAVPEALEARNSACPAVLKRRLYIDGVFLARRKHGYRGDGVQGANVLWY